MVNHHQFAADWIAAWNSRDLEDVLSHYAEEVVFFSPYAQRLTGNGRVEGKAGLRSYWRVGLAANRDLHFVLEQVLEGHEALTLIYRNQHGMRVAETFAFDAAGKVAQSFACYAGND